MNNFKYKGEELTFSANGVVTHSTYGKLGSKTSEIETWKTLVKNFQSSDTYPYIQLLAREVWNSIPLPPMFGVTYKVDKNYIHTSPIVDISLPFDSSITIKEGWGEELYLSVNTPRPFHFWNEDSVEEVLALINTHIEQQEIDKKAREERREQAQKDILLSIEELLKGNPNLVFKKGDSWSMSEIEVQFEGKWVGVIELTNFAQVALPELYKQLM